MPRKKSSTATKTTKKSEVAAKTTDKETTKAAPAKTEDVKAEAVKKEAPVEKKTDAAKPAESTKAKSTKAAPAKKPVAKKVDRVQEIYLEIQGNQIETNDIIKKIEEAYKAEGHQIGRIKDLKVYVNYDESRAYYVINEKPEDKYVEL